MAQLSVGEQVATINWVMGGSEIPQRQLQFQESQTLLQYQAGQSTRVRY
jgi:hypothetical protein